MSTLEESLAELKAEIDALPGRINDKIGALTDALAQLKVLTDEFADYRKAEDEEDVEQNAEIEALRGQLTEQLELATQAAADISAEAKRLSGVAVDEPEAPVVEEPEAPAPEAPTGPSIIPDTHPNPSVPDSEITDDAAATE